MKHTTDEQELAIRAQQGDREALEALVEGARLRLFALAYAELRHYQDAQDAVASALLQICLHARDLREPDAIRPWMNSIVRNEARRLRRGAKVENVALDSLIEIGAEDRSPHLRMDIEQALRQLPQDQARALALYHFSALSISEIAARFERPEGTIKRWLHNGRLRMAQELKGYRPMAQEWTASILASDITQEQLQDVTTALDAAGWNRIHTLKEIDGIDTLYTVDNVGGHVWGRLNTPEGTREYTDKFDLHLAPSLAESQLLIMTLHIAGSSAFELIPILRAMEERKKFRICLLVHGGITDSINYSCFLLGLDTVLCNPSVEQLTTAFTNLHPKLEANA